MNLGQSIRPFLSRLTHGFLAVHLDVYFAIYEAVLRMLAPVFSMDIVKGFPPCSSFIMRVPQSSTEKLILIQSVDEEGNQNYSACGEDSLLLSSERTTMIETNSSVFSDASGAGVL